MGLCNAVKCEEEIWGRESLCVYATDIRSKYCLCVISHKSKKKFGAKKKSNEIQTGVFISATKVTKICFGNKKRSIFEAFF